MRRVLAILALALATPVAAQPAPAPVVASPGPAAVSVTVYRAPGRSADSAIDRDFPEGYALITETRTVTIPAGASTIRFEGVASGIFAESAIVSGLPDGVREKNLDADLLSPRSLFDRALGRRVLLRRTNPATGKVSEEQAVIRSSAGGGMVVTTAAGVEALHCSGLAEAVIQDSVPTGLTPKPTLSVAIDSPAAATVTLTLSYLAGGFDWQANYVATMRPDGRSADLFAWLTLVSDDVTSFVDAGTQVVAGKANREGDWDTGDQFTGGAKDYRCWRTGPIPPPPPPPPPAMAAPAPMALDEAAGEVVVTGSRIAARLARQEELGDFKLYRVPQPVTVAAQAQKQVALLDKPAVPVRAVYVSEARSDWLDDPRLTLRARNRAAEGLGLALPAGRIAVFQPVGGGRDVLVGETGVTDKAVGEDVEYRLDTTPNVTAKLIEKDGGRDDRYRIAVTNANPWPIAYEVKFRPEDDVRFRPDARLVERDGYRVWAVTVPANASLTLSYRVTSSDRSGSD